MALRSASRLARCVPVVALVKPGNSKITQEPASSSLTLTDIDGRSVTTLISVPLRIVLVVAFNLFGDAVRDALDPKANH